MVAVGNRSTVVAAGLAASVVAVVATVGCSH